MVRVYERGKSDARVSTTDFASFSTSPIHNSTSRVIRDNSRDVWTMASRHAPDGGEEECQLALAFISP